MDVNTDETPCPPVLDSYVPWCRARTRLVYVCDSAGFSSSSSMVTHATISVLQVSVLDSLMNLCIYNFFFLVKTKLFWIWGIMSVVDSKMLSIHTLCYALSMNHRRTIALYNMYCTCPKFFAFLVSQYLGNLMYPSFVGWNSVHPSCDHVS